MNISLEAIELVIIEDCMDDAELFLRILKKKSLFEKALHFLNGEDALSTLFHKNESGDTACLLPKVIILDIKMPKMDGFTVLEALKAGQSTRFVPVLIFTSSQQQQDIQKAYELGANGYVVKPLEYEHFVATVENIIGFWLLHNTTIKNTNGAM